MALRILLWKPSGALCDTAGIELEPGLVFQGMRAELKHLEECQTGTVLTEEEAQDLKARLPHTRMISTRWVTTFKNPQKVRCRVVARDIARGETARSLGYSSPTPSSEALQMCLCICAQQDFRLLGIDAEHAFMHASMPSDQSVALKLPLSISGPEGGVRYLHLSKALNGLRDASLRWLQLLSSAMPPGIASCDSEPCVYSGEVVVKGQFLGLCMVIAYVDDVLIMSSTEKAESLIVKSISTVVPIKRTGSILDSKNGGGELTFIGRRVRRWPGSPSLEMSVDPEYLTSCMNDFQLKKDAVNVAAPDLGPALEKAATSDPKWSMDLTGESYGRFRKCLGKIAWLSQVRQNLKLFVSLVATQQAAPKHGTEHALKQLLRFAYSDRFTILEIPSSKLKAEMEQEGFSVHAQLRCMSDASHAPHAFSKRRGITGGVIFYACGLIKSLAKHQQSVSLSSCEPELHSIQHISQEAVGISRLLHRLLYSLWEIKKQERVLIILDTDSRSGLDLIRGQDIPKRSRHIDVRVEWIREKICNKELEIRFKRGYDNISDVMTKCLSSSDFNRHRESMGFITRDGPVNLLFALGSSGKQSWLFKGLVVVEICCQPDSKLAEACKVSDIRYAGVAANMEDSSVFLRLKRWIQEQKSLNKWVHVHASTPCITGSQIWPAIMSKAGDDLFLGNSSSFELPRFNAIGGRDLTVEAADALKHECVVHLCATGVKTSKGEPVGEQLKFRASHFLFAKSLSNRFGKCTCVHGHAPFDNVTWAQTAYYNGTLARGLINTAKSVLNGANKQVVLQSK